MPKYDTRNFLNFSIKPEKDCIFKATATVTQAQQKGKASHKRTGSLKSPIRNTDNSFNSSQDFYDRNLSLDPSKRQLFIEMLHKRDNSSSKYLELDFGEFLIDKKVRDRAIADRVEQIKLSHIQKLKFEEQFREAKREKKASMFRSLGSRDDFVEVNKQAAEGWLRSMKENIIKRA